MLASVCNRLAGVLVLSCIVWNGSTLKQDQHQITWLLDNHLPGFGRISAHAVISTREFKVFSSNFALMSLTLCRSFLRHPRSRGSSECDEGALLSLCLTHARCNVAGLGDPTSQGYLFFSQTLANHVDAATGFPGNSMVLASLSAPSAPGRRLLVRHLLQTQVHSTVVISCFDSSNAEPPI